MKQTILFADANNNRCTVTIETRKNERNAKDWNTLETVNGWDELSMTGETQNCCGQCYDEINPTPTQAKLINFWRNYHLNTMQAGTKAQTEAIEAARKNGEPVNGYDEICAYLEKIGLLEDRGYRYGTDWLAKTFDAQELAAIIEEVEQEEAARKEENEEKSEYNIENDNDFDMLDAIQEEKGCTEDEAVRMVALMRELGMTFAELDDIDGSGYEYTAQGVDYIVGEDDELDQIARDRMKEDDDCYLESWIEQVRNHGERRGFDEWCDYVVDMDGWCQILNSYDGRYTDAYCFGENLCISRR